MHIRHVMWEIRNNKNIPVTAQKIYCVNDQGVAGADKYVDPENILSLMRASNDSQRQ